MKTKLLFAALGAALALGLTFAWRNHQGVDMLPTSARADEKAEPQTIKTYPVVLPSHVDFCGEAAPLGDRDVQERLDRELLVNTYWQSQTLLILKEYNKLKPMLEPVLKEYHVPSDFIFLAAAESGFKNVVSPSNAVGIWQLLGETGRHYGLEINDEVDERYHFVKSTEAACKYLLDAYNKFGSWTLVAASYNMGMDGLRKTKDQQLANSYYDMMLSSETQRYVFRILAMKEILSNPQRYGFMITPNDLYQPYRFDEVKVDTAVGSWGKFALQYNLSYKDLKILNPWMRSYKLTNKQAKAYSVYVMQKPKDQ
jgi:membrane-bound lytic murein transglycosylase D